MQNQPEFSYKLAINQVCLQFLIINSHYCPDTIFLFFIMVTLTPGGSKCNTKRGPHISLL
jgi:hypothetical protein